MSKVRSSECWLWAGALNDNGYGAFRINPTEAISAHRAAYRLLVGEVPDDLEVCHRCDNRDCVNPAHMFLGTKFENHRDAIQKGRKKGISRDAAYAEIRALHAEGKLTGRQIAQRFGISHTAVQKIVRKAPVP